MEMIYKLLRSLKWTCSRFLYMNTLKMRIRKVRQKENIRVLFAVAETATWKNDTLYKAMLKHPRFTPLLLILPDEQKEANLSKEEVDLCFDFFFKRGYACSYPYQNGKLINIRKVLKPDIIFYQKPYKAYPRSLLYYKNMNALFCYTNYAFHSLLEEWANENAFFRLVWQNYYENESAYADLKKKFSEVSSNVVVTGLPVTDLFLNRKKHEDRWKETDKKRKRIIWAPHFSISGDGCLNYSTFLSVAEDMLEFV